MDRRTVAALSSLMFFLAGLGWVLVGEFAAGCMSFLLTASMAFHADTLTSSTHERDAAFRQGYKHARDIVMTGHEHEMPVGAILEMMSNIPTYEIYLKIYRSAGGGQGG